MICSPASKLEKTPHRGNPPQAPPDKPGETAEPRGSIDAADLARLLGCALEELPAPVQEGLAEIDTNYSRLSRDEAEAFVLEVLTVINTPGVARNRDENLTAWENGWSENLAEFQDRPTADALKPKYFRASRFFRYDGDIVKPDNPHIEHDLFTLVRHHLFQTIFRDFGTIYELGCGSCQNLWMLSQLYPEKKLHGMDWAKASVGIAEELRTRLGRNVQGHWFDMKNPDPGLDLDPKALVFSIHALEQLGTDHTALIAYLLEKPAMVFHYEPVLEFYDESNLYDLLALMYSRKRNYLNEYLTELRRLEAQGALEIIDARRPYIGGVHHESSFIIWRPL